MVKVKCLELKEFILNLTVLDLRVNVKKTVEKIKEIWQYL